MLCAVFAIPQCGFISFASGKVVIFHSARHRPRLSTVRAFRMSAGGGQGGGLKYSISIYCNFILIRPRLKAEEAPIRTGDERVYLFYIYTKPTDDSSTIISAPSTTGDIGK